jgi:hypothetical protein
MDYSPMHTKNQRMEHPATITAFNAEGVVIARIYLTYGTWAGIEAARDYILMNVPDVVRLTINEAV